MKLKTCLIKLIKFYKKISRLIKKRSCIFYPTCSDYAIDAINKYGAIKGTGISLLRIFRCHPWQKNHIDPVE